MQNKTIEEKYLLFIGTLNLILLPFKEIGVSYVELIQGQLEELEGDYYSFLNIDFTKELNNCGYITNEVLEITERIRFNISNIDSSHWNAKHFIYHSEWVEIRNLVLDIFRSKLTE